MRLFPLYVTGIMLAAFPARASLQDYLAARKQFPPRAGVTVASIRQKPDQFRNVVFELSGTVAGRTMAESFSNLLVRDGSGEVHLVRASPGARLPDSGENVRVLLTVEEQGRLRLLSVATLTEIGNTVFDTPAPKSAAKGPVSRFSRFTVKHDVPSFSRSSIASRSKESEYVVKRYKETVLWFNKKLTEAQADKIARSILMFSYENNVDPRLVMAVVATESNFKTKAKSRAGAMGLGQLMPGTAKSLGVRNAYDPVDNLWGAVKLIGKHLDTYGRDAKGFALSCAAYNAGPNAVKKYGGIPPYKETRDYVKKVAYWYGIFAPANADEFPQG